MANITKLTQEFIDKFITLVTENGGIIQDACTDCNVSRTAIYNLRNEESEDGRSFRERLAEAVDIGIDVIEDEAKRRALAGTEEPVYYQGEVVGTIHKKSDYCLGLILKAHRRKYRDKHEFTGADGAPLQSSIIILPDNGRGDGKPVENETDKQE